MCSYDSFHSLSTSGRRGGLMISVLDCGSRGLGSRPGRSGHCVVFLGKTLYFHSVSLQPEPSCSKDWYLYPMVNHYTADKCSQNVLRYPADGVIHTSNNRARSINVFQRNVKEAWWNAGGGGPCEGLASHPVGNSNTPCRSMLHRNRDKLPLDGTLDSSTDFSLKILLTYSQGHFWQLWNVWVFDSTL